MESLILNEILKWSPSAVTFALVIAVIFLIKKVNSNAKEEEERATQLRKEINTTLNSFGERLSNVEQNYVKNELFFRENSGWRSEINRLSDLIVSQFMSFSKDIILLLSKGTK